MTDRLRVDGRDACPVEHARSLAGRSRGLLGRDRLDGALWLWRTTSVHTIGMRMPIDVVHCDRTGRVRSVTTMRPGRIGMPRRRARSVVELEAGLAARLGIVPGVILSSEVLGAAPSRRIARTGRMVHRAEGAATMVEYVGIIAVVAAVSTALLYLPVGAQLRHRLATAMCEVVGRSGCDPGGFADGSTDPDHASNHPPPRCVSHADAVDLDLDVGFGRFALVGGSERLLREDRSDGTVAIALVGDVLAGVGIGGEFGLQVGDTGGPTGAYAQIDARFGAGATWVFAGADDADAFVRWIATHPTGDPLAGLAVAGTERVASLFGVDAEVPPPPRRLDVHAGVDVSAALSAIGQLDAPGLADSIELVRGRLSARFGATSVIGITIDLDTSTITAHLDGGLASEVVAGVSTRPTPGETAIGGGSASARSVGLVYDFGSRLRRLDIDGSAPVDAEEATRIGGAASFAELESVLGAGGYRGATPDLVAQIHVSLDLDDPTNRAALDDLVDGFTAGDGGTEPALAELAHRLNAAGQVSATTAAVSDTTVFRLGIGLASLGAERSSQDLRDAYYLDRSRGGLVRWRDCG